MIKEGVEAVAQGDNYDYAVGVETFVWSETSGDATATVTVADGGVSAAGYEADGVVVNTKNIDEGTAAATLEITDDVSATDTAYGLSTHNTDWTEDEVSAVSGENGVLTVKAEGVEAEAEGFQAIGVYVDAEDNGTVNLEIGEEGITATAGVYAAGAVLTANGGTVNATVGEGGISATGDGFSAGAVLTASNEGNVNLTVEGDVAGDTAGLVIGGLEPGASDGTGTIDAFIEETLSGENAVVVASAELEDNLTLTVWQATVNKETNRVVTSAADYEKFVGYEYSDEEKEALAATAQKVEEKIQYIIKLEQPEAGANLSVTDKDGNALKKKNNYDVANENDTVILKVNLQEGYTLTGAFNGVNEKVELQQDGDGNYYVVVPKGGGVYLSVTLDGSAVVSDDNGNQGKNQENKNQENNNQENKNQENNNQGNNNQVIVPDVYVVPVQVEVVSNTSQKKAATIKPAVAMKVVRVGQESAEYELTVNVPAGGFPDGFDLTVLLPQSGLYADVLDQVPTTEGLTDGELCTYSTNGNEVQLRFYQNYTDENNNMPGLQPGARTLKIYFTTRHAPNWPDGAERVTTITATAGNGKETLTLTGKVNEATGAMFDAKWTVVPAETAGK